MSEDCESKNKLKTHDAVLCGVRVVFGILQAMIKRHECKW